MPQFSIVIPCYNCKDTISNTLTSILNQHLGDKIEVILVDDCSTEDYLEKIDEFKEKLNIKFIKNETNLGVGMTRQKGLEAAEGDWVTFCDNDDTFIPNTFNRIRTIIRNNPSRNIIQARFQEVPNGDSQPIPYSFERGMNWIHGKFFKNSFIKKYKLSFKEGLSTHEDIYFSILTRLMTNHLGTPILNCDLIIYNWYNRPESLSHRRETGLDLFEGHFEDYVSSAFDPIVYLKDYLTEEEKMSQTISVILFTYFYAEGFLTLNRGHNDRDLKLLNQIIVQTKEITGFNSNQIIDIIYSNPGVYCAVRNKSFDSVGPFIENMDLRKIIFNSDESSNEQN